MSNSYNTYSKSTMNYNTYIVYAYAQVELIENLNSTSHLLMETCIKIYKKYLDFELVLQRVI